MENVRTTRKSVLSKICPTCSLSFVPSHGLQVFCTEKCGWDYRRAIKKSKSGIASLCICGASFIKIHGNQKFCSYECRYKSTRPTPKIFSAKNCNICGVSFTPKSSRGRFCSVSCGEKNKWRKKNKNRSNRCKSIGYCEVCGYSFKPALEAHHYSPKDLICLCGNCHNIWHNLSKVKYSTKEELISFVKDKLWLSLQSAEVAQISVNSLQKSGL